MVVAFVSKKLDLFFIYRTRSIVSAMISIAVGTDGCRCSAIGSVVGFRAANAALLTFANFCIVGEFVAVKTLPRLIVESGKSVELEPHLKF